MSSATEILDFWFGTSQAAATPSQVRKVWFAKDPEFDQLIQNRFQATYEQAAAGQLNHWQALPEGCVALILLLDQFPRHMFRGKPRAFSTDHLALSIAQQAINHGFDQQLPALQCWFLYIPFMHSEQLEQQRQSVELFRQLKDAEPKTASAFCYAVKHLEVVEQFGRFPHRNSILGRVSTPEEVAFLKQRGSSF
ncbi:MAG TPA: DUF924 family protein [Candidatus Caenarcaniphilales bacterium]